MPTAAPPLSDAVRRALAEGAARFDAGRFFEAHEVWEDAWRVESGATRLLLQGLIQVAAGFHKGLVQRRPSGMARLLGAGLAKLEATACPGTLDLGAFVAAIQAWRGAAEAWADGEPEPALDVPRVGPALPRDPPGFLPGRACASSREP